MSPHTDPERVWEHLISADAERRYRGLHRELRPRSADARLIDLASNDYLSLARDPRVVAAAADASQRWGAGATASRLVTGALDLHAELELALAEATGAAAGVLFSSGYLANLGAVTALADTDTLILSDEQNHASLIDACRLSRADVHVFGHRNAAEVAEVLATRSQPRALVITDAVFSVDGDVAPLAALHAACRQHGAALLIDEAHSVGVLGPRGGGAAAAAGLAGAPDVVLTLTLSKSLAAQGGAVLGSQIVVTHLINTARSLIFDTGLAPASAAAALAALGILRREPDLPLRAVANAHVLRQLGQLTGRRVTSPDAAVVSVIADDPAAAVAAQRACAELGVAVGCFRPPSVPDGRARLRLTSHAGLTDPDLDRAGEVLAAAMPAPAGAW